MDIQNGIRPSWVMVVGMELTPFHGPPRSAPQIPGLVARTLLGFGAHGEVWLADDLDTGDSVAVKVGRGAATGGIERETALLCRIDHPHIVRLRRAVPFGDGELALVLDYAAGGSLASLVAGRGPFEPGEVSTLLIPLAGALEHLHRRGVVHGDLAPGNVLFTGDGRPQLGDLGVARVLGTRSDEVWATPGFTDPAMVDGSGDPRSADLWGLAAVAWFALTGRPPETVTRSEAHRRAPALAELLGRCLAPMPADRPGLDELADQAWQAVRPVPVRLVSDRIAVVGEQPLPGPMSRRVTRPVAEAAGPVRSSVDRGTADRGSIVHRSGVRSSAVRRSVNGTARRRGRAARGRMLGVGAVLLATAACVAGAVVARGPGSGRSGVHPVAVAATSGVATSLAPDHEPGTALEAELRTALDGIGRSRAAAFAQASRAELADADQSGSPAYRDDLALVQRLQARGVRLRGVSYQVTGVHVLHRRGDSVEVSALVTTSAHAQVVTATSASVPVPADGPRPVVFIVVPQGSAGIGPARWRVHQVRAA